MGFLNLIVDVQRIEKWSNENKGGNVNAEEKQRVLDSGGNINDHRTTDNTSVNKKRRREYYMGMLNWICKVAKDPSNPATEQLPNKNTWRYYGSERPWKKVLLAREATFLKKNVGASSELSVWQKKQKMHPSMYNDDECGSVRMRCSQRRFFVKDSSHKACKQLGLDSSSSSCQSDEDFTDEQFDSIGDSASFWGKYSSQKRVRIGTQFQADLSELSGLGYKSDSKWLGTKIWPLRKGESRQSLIERERIGKGREESCCCQFPSSSECIRFHVQEKTIKIKLELGPAFYRWKFDSMGEEVAFSWTKFDETTFQDIVKSNRLSSEKYFWDELFKFFPKKGREALVSYYFNVFLLRRRGQQNRSAKRDIGSDDEESEFGPVANKFGQIAATSPGSIFCSPKKSHSNGR